MKIDRHNDLLFMNDNYGPFEAYSYTTCLMVRTKNEVYILNVSDYSHTSSKHLGEVRRALPAKAKIIEVSNIERNSGKDRLLERAAELAEEKLLG